MALEIPFYVGTYTDHSSSKGIYLGHLNSETGELGPLILAGETSNPSFLTLSPNQDFLYAVLDQGDGGVASFRLEDGGKLQPLNRVSIPGGAGHVSIDSTGRRLFTASWGGTVSSFSVTPDGSIQGQTSRYAFQGSGPAMYQDAAHPHSIYPDPTGRFAYACDLGSDVIGIFDLNPETGSLTPRPPFGHVPPGNGPRHLAFGPGGRFVYVNNQMGRSISVFARDPSTGALALLQTIPTLPPDAVFPANTDTSEIACHPSGRWIYVANRYADSISAYSIETDGRLKWIETRPAEVKTPRSFAIDPSGRWLLVGGQQDNLITVLRIDSATGELSSTGNITSVPSPSCVLFGMPPQPAG